jgi:ParB family chromosome partitioning protein
MGRSLGQLVNGAEQARAMVASGLSIAEIDADKIDASFVSDRFDGDEEEYRALVESIRERGQQVPVLVRPHPERPERYQIAYGHRRVRALRELGRTVRAVVRSLSDEDLVVAQGQENSARSDLSYIERARFAIALSDRGFDRSVIMAALTLEKTQLSRLIGIGRAIPPDIIDAIGPAPKAGRPRWAALAEKLRQAKSRKTLDETIMSAQFREANTDMRFAMALAALTPKLRKHAKPIALRSNDGKKVATILRTDTRLAVIVDYKIFPDFGEFVAGQLPGLYRAFQSEKERDSK